MPVELYNYEYSVPCRVVRMVAQHIGLPLALKKVDIFGCVHQKHDLMKINPAHTTPSIVDGSLTLFESRAIITYLVDKYAPDSPLYPRNVEKRATIDSLLFFDIGTLQRSLSNFFFPIFLDSRNVSHTACRAMVHALRELSNLLRDNRYLTGSEITLADIAVAGSLSLADMVGFKMNQFPKVRDYYTALKRDLPYFRQINVVQVSTLKCFART
ncbi:glutathione S-transferase 1-like [Ixodes scapularis]|uniref:glutathione S-transferase 1-like n=1 Tax=Ixodes scapularis TaxID=6945 RepID=UPI0011616FAD|nr:glutathione S-transferase 1-like [Ixodes scapularis]